MDQMVEELDGVEVIMDDVIVGGDEATHDTITEISGKSIKMGSEVLYVRHLLTATGFKIDPQNQGQKRMSNDFLALYDF